MTEDADRRLFEQAVSELDGASRSRLGRLKAGGRAAPKLGARVRRRTSRRLDKLGKQAMPEAVVDLHGLDRRSAVARVGEFLASNRQRELVLVVHGKGRGILQQRIEQFLNQEPRVAEHAVAPQRLGGSGARLVRLRRF